MPTYEVVARFWQDWNKLTADQQRRVRQALERFVEDLRRGHGFRPGLRIKGIQGADGMFEMTWTADDGRATFHYGERQSPNEPHIVWRRIGTHDISKAP